MDPNNNLGDASLSRFAPALYLDDPRVLAHFKEQLPTTTSSTAAGLSTAVSYLGTGAVVIELLSSFALTAIASAGTVTGTVGSFTPGAPVAAPTAAASTAALAVNLTRLYRATKAISAIAAAYLTGEGAIRTASLAADGNAGGATREGLATIASGLSLFGATRYLKAARSRTELNSAIATAQREARAFKHIRSAIGSGEFWRDVSASLVYGASAAVNRSALGRTLARLLHLEHFAAYTGLSQRALHLRHVASAKRAIESASRLKNAVCEVHSLRHSAEVRHAREDGTDGFDDALDILSSVVIIVKGGQHLSVAKHVKETIAKRATDVLGVIYTDLLTKETALTALLPRDGRGNPRPIEMIATEFRAAHQLLAALRTLRTTLAAFQAFMDDPSLAASEAAVNSGLVQMLEGANGRLENSEGEGEPLSGDVARGLLRLVLADLQSTTAAPATPVTAGAFVEVGDAAAYNPLIHAIQARFRVLQALGLWNDATIANLAPRFDYMPGSPSVQVNVSLNNQPTPVNLFQVPASWAMDMIAVSLGLLTSDNRSRVFTPYSYQLVYMETNDRENIVRELADVFSAPDIASATHEAIRSTVATKKKQSSDPYRVEKAVPLVIDAFDAAMAPPVPDVDIEAAINDLVSNLTGPRFTEALINYMVTAATVDQIAFAHIATNVNSAYNAAVKTARSQNDQNDYDVFRPANLFGNTRGRLIELSGANRVLPLASRSSLPFMKGQMWFQRIVKKDQAVDRRRSVSAMHSYLEGTPGPSVSDLTTMAAPGSPTLLEVLEAADARFLTSFERQSVVRSGTLSEYVTLTIPERIFLASDAELIIHADRNNPTAPGRTVSRPIAPGLSEIVRSALTEDRRNQLFSDIRTQRPFQAIGSAEATVPLSALLLATALEGKAAREVRTREGAYIAFGVTAYRGKRRNPVDLDYDVEAIPDFCVPVRSELLRQARSVATAAVLRSVREPKLIQDVRLKNTAKFGRLQNP